MKSTLFSLIVLVVTILALTNGRNTPASREEDHKDIGHYGLDSVATEELVQTAEIEPKSLATEEVVKPAAIDLNNEKGRNFKLFKKAHHDGCKKGSHGHEYHQQPQHYHPYGGLKIKH